jgi:hypothetical protein
MNYTIVLFPKIQVDTTIAYFLLTTFGEQAFPGVADAPVEFWSEMPSDRTVEELETEGYILVDLGHSMFDHHRLGPENRKITSSYLIAAHLGIADRPDLQKLLELARRDDLEGKGTLSSDPIDRAFGISALLTNLNKSMPNSSRAVLDVIVPLITAHFLEENRRHELMPKEHQELVQSGKVREFNANHFGRIIKVLMVESDNMALAGYLRSRAVGAGLVIQKASSGHVNFVSNQNANLKLHKLSRLIKLAEAGKNNLVLQIDSMEELEKPGRTKDLPHWYYDSRANTLQNGGMNPQGIPATLLTHDEIIEITKDGLNIISQNDLPRKNFHDRSRHKITRGNGVVYLD